MDYAERLTVPLRWWVQGTMLVASLWLAVLAATPEVVAWSVSAVALALMVALLVGYGSAARSPSRVGSCGPVGRTSRWSTSAR